MPKEIGRYLQLHSGDGASPEVFANVPAETVNLQLSSARADATDNESSGWGATLGARRDGTVTISGPFNDDHVKHILLQTQWTAQTPFSFRVIMGSSGGTPARWEGQFVVTDLQFGGSVEQAKTFSATLNSFNALTYVAEVP